MGSSIESHHELRLCAEAGYKSTWSLKSHMYIQNGLDIFDSESSEVLSTSLST